MTAGANEGKQKQKKIFQLRMCFSCQPLSFTENASLSFLLTRQTTTNKETQTNSLSTTYQPSTRGRTTAIQYQHKRRTTTHQNSPGTLPELEQCHSPTEEKNYLISALPSQIRCQTFFCCCQMGTASKRMGTWCRAVQVPSISSTSPWPRHTQQSHRQ